MGATRNTGYLENLIAYDASDNVAIATSVNPSYKVTLGGSLSGTAAVFSSSVTSTAFVPTGSTIPTNGMYLSAANTLNFATNSANRLSISTSTITSTLALSGTSATFNFVRSINETGFLLRNDANSANLGGLTRRSYWAGGTAADTQIFAETGYAIYLNPGGSSSIGLTLASTGAATFSSSVTAGQGLFTSSSFPLDLTANTNNYGIRLTSVQAPTLLLYSTYANSGNRNWGIYTNSNVFGDFDIRQSNAKDGDMTVGGNGTSRFYIKNDGNVGIGTTSPDVTGFGYTTLTIKGGTTAGYAGVLELQTTQTTTNGQNIGIMAFLDGTSRNAQIGVQRDTSTSTANMMFYTNAGAGIVERMRITSGGKLLVGTSSTANTGLGTKTKQYIVGDGSTNAAASHGSMFVAAGTGTADTGISVNQGTSGMTMILIASINTSTGTSTNSAVYIVRFYFDGNNTPTATYIGGSSDFVTFSTSGSNTLNLTGSSSGNKSYAWFVNKFGDV